MGIFFPLPGDEVEQEDLRHASSVNMFKNKIDKYLVKAGYT